jgi:hypothetical protein
LRERIAAREPPPLASNADLGDFILVGIERADDRLR